MEAVRITEEEEEGGRKAKGWGEKKKEKEQQTHQSGRLLEDDGTTLERDGLNFDLTGQAKGQAIKSLGRKVVLKGLTFARIVLARKFV